MKFTTIKCHDENRGNKREMDTVKYIVIHYTGNSKDTAKNNCLYFQKNVVKASAHYFVDETNVVYKSCPVSRVAYAVGGSLYNNTKGGTYYKKCTNSNSISIEMCNSKTKNAKVENNAIELVKFLMNKYKIPADNVIRHYDVNGKQCPLTMLDSANWKAFKNKLI